MDGSQKLPQRLLGTVRDNLAAGRRIDLLTLAVAGWMRYVSGRDERNGEIFGSDLPGDPRFTAAVSDWLTALYADGAGETVARAVRSSPGR